MSITQLISIVVPKVEGAISSKWSVCGVRKLSHKWNGFPLLYSQSGVAVRHHTTNDCHDDKSIADHIDVKWKLKDGSIKDTRVKIGTNIMWAARFNDVELEGACEGVCACSTCHVILEDDVFDALQDADLEASEDEEDMLDQAFGCVYV